MKGGVLLYCLLLAFAVSAQENEKLSSTAAQQLEGFAQSSDPETADDSYLQQLEHYKDHPLNMNTATEEDLAALNLLTGLQVQQFITYRKLLGRLVNLYELQAIPAWDIGTIKNLLPFVTVDDDNSLAAKLRDRWRGGNSVTILRYGRVLEKSKGYNKPDTGQTGYYLGSRDKIFFRYTYRYKQLLQYGLLGDKDAGEQFFKGHQRFGFDFYSFHLFARQLGIIKALALGDFTVNFGQGLIQWQSLAFKKNADALAIKRQAATIRPYNSAGEYNFHRGIGITLQKENWEATLFASYRKLTANTVPDTSFADGAVSSFSTSGYHRTPAENEDRNSVQQTAMGANIRYQRSNWHTGVSSIYYHFSKPVQKAPAPYNAFALQGTLLVNTSIDYSYTWRNMHVFGELATDQTFNKAFIQGALISVDATADVSIFYRNISRAYRSLNADAFTENTYPVNEHGLYTGLSVRPFTGIRLDAYADVFAFPWLKYRVDAPSVGKDYLVQATFTPVKRIELYMRYKREVKVINRSGSNAITSIPDAVPQSNLRLQTGIALNKEVSLLQRTELVWYNRDAAAGQGFTTYMEAAYKPLHKPWQGNLRLQYFETDGYNERLYTYETGMPYSFSIPFYYDRGIHYYLTLNGDASRLLGVRRKHRTSFNCWLQWAQTVYPGKATVGTGLDESKGNHHSEIKFQLVVKR